MIVKTVKWKRHDGETVDVHFEAHEWEWFADRRRELDLLGHGPKRAEIANSIANLLEIKATFDATMIEQDTPLPASAGKGRYYGVGATATERASGVVVEQENLGPLRQGGAGHRALRAFASGDRLTAYDASESVTGDFHAMRREATRLMERGLLVKDGELPNRAPRGRGRVDAFRITAQGQSELARLG